MKALFLLLFLLKSSLIFAQDYHTELKDGKRCIENGIKGIIRPLKANVDFSKMLIQNFDCLLDGKVRYEFFVPNNPKNTCMINSNGNIHTNLQPFTCPKTQSINEFRLPKEIIKALMKLEDQFEIDHEQVWKVASTVYPKLRVSSLIGFEAEKDNGITLVFLAEYKYQTKLQYCKKEYEIINGKLQVDIDPDDIAPGISCDPYDFD